MRRLLVLLGLTVVLTGCQKQDIYTGYYYPEGFLGKVIKQGGFISIEYCEEWAKAQLKENVPNQEIKCGKNCSDNICEQMSSILK